MSIKLGKINIGRNTKTFTRDMSFDVNTTSDFGFCQPNLMLLVNPKSNVSIKARSLVRLAPMPAPSFARMSLISKYSFVPYADVCEYYEAMLEGTPQGERDTPFAAQWSNEAIPSLLSDVPSHLPYVTPFWLFLNLVCRADNYVSIYKGTTQTKQLVEIDPYKVNEANASAARQLIVGSIVYNACRAHERFDNYTDSGNLVQPVPFLDYDNFCHFADYDSFKSNIGNSLNPESADFILEVDAAKYKSEWSSYYDTEFATQFTTLLSSFDSSNPLDSFTIAVRLGNKGRRLLKILRGLGYSLDVTDFNTSLNLLPLLAYYKAWFDNYSPNTNNSPWTTTACYRLIKKFDGLNWTSDLDMMFANEPYLYQYWLEFFYNELPNTYYTNECDFISAHTTSVNQSPYGLFHTDPDYSWSTNTPNSALGFRGFNSSDGTVHRLDSCFSNPVTGGSSEPVQLINPVTPNIKEVSSSSPLTILQLRLLNTLSKWVNKDSVIGTKLSDYMRVHFGADVANVLLQNAYNLGTSVTPININDIYSNSDTMTDTGGDYLGAYAGKGIGFGNTDIHFQSDKHGIIIGMMAIVPENNFYQGYDTSLLGVDPYTIPRPEFDALGYELTGKGAFVDTPYMLLSSTGGVPASHNESFGYIPRFSGFKFKHNVVNGDFRRQSTADSLSCYYLDKQILTDNVQYGTTSTEGTYTAAANNYFLNIPKASPEWRYVGKYPWLGNLNRIFYNDSSTSAKSGYSDDLIDDNFIIQQAYDIKVTDFLKPLSMSYDTFDEDVDNSSMSVHKD